MPNLFARQTALTDVTGRIDYISNPTRQEHLLATYDTAADLLGGQFWQILAQECQAAFKKSGVKTRTVNGEEKELQCCEGREIFFLLGNEVLDRLSGDEILKIAVDKVSEKVGRPASGALQFNDERTSLHVHVVFPEREFLEEPMVKVAERNLFFDADGKRRYKKREILDEEGQLLPGCRIVQKGEIYESRCFGSVDPKFSRKGWLEEMKEECILALRNGELKGDVEITKYDPSTGMLPQQYIGKALYEKEPAKAAAIAEDNALIRKYNDIVLRGLIDRERALEYQQMVRQAKRKSEILNDILAQIQEAQKEEQDRLQAQMQTQKRSLGAMMGSAAARSGGHAEGWQAKYWQQYKQVRDDTWSSFIQGQRNEFKAIKTCYADLRVLRAANSHVVKGSGKVRLNSPKDLEQAGYYEKRDQLKEDLNKHKGQLAAQRKYQEVAKGRQKIVRALLLADADEATVKSAMREYEEAMKLLQNHVENPDFDYENRRLKVAQTSLALAQARAERYIKQLEEKKLQEENPKEATAEKEYQDFKRDGALAEKGDDRGIDGRSRPAPLAEISR